MLQFVDCDFVSASHLPQLITFPVLQNFTKMITPLGICYTFTTSVSTNGIVQTIPGSGHGLTMNLDINQVSIA